LAADAGLVDAASGKHAEAERLAREAVAIAARTHALNLQGDALCDLAEVLADAGEPDEAGAALQQALARYERKENIVMAERVRARLAELQLSRNGRRAGVKAYFEALLGHQSTRLGRRARSLTALQSCRAQPGRPRRRRPRPERRRELIPPSCSVGTTGIASASRVVPPRRGERSCLDNCLLAPAFSVLPSRDG